MNWLNQLRTLRWAFSGRKHIRKEVRKKLAFSEPIQIILGAGHHLKSNNNWINTDLPQFDITNESHWNYIFQKECINVICAEHVLEHLHLNQIKKALQLSSLYLKSKGIFRIAIPDKNNPDPLYQAGTKVGGTDIGAHDHKVFLNKQDIESICHNLPFKIQFLEYYDESGKFHSTEYNTQAGLIKRSHQQQFHYTPIPNYSSLIFDLIKK